MKVTMLDCEGGYVWPDQGPVYLRAGETHDVPDAVAEKWISIGLAERAPVVAVYDNDDAVPTTRPRRRAAGN